MANVEEQTSSELVLSDLATSHGQFSPGLISGDMGTSLSISDSLPPSRLVTGGKPRPQDVPLLCLPPEESSRGEATEAVRVLSDLYPGVDNFLCDFPSIFGQSKTRSRRAPPLLKVTDPSVMGPSIAPPIFQVPKFYAHSKPRGVPQLRPQMTNERAEFVLPNIPVKPFIPLLIPPDCVAPPTYPLPLLRLDDPLSRMKREGFRLLHMPCLPNRAPPTVCKPTQVQLTFYKPNHSRRKKKKQNGRPSKSPTNCGKSAPPTEDTPTPPATSDVSVEATPQAIHSTRRDIVPTSDPIHIEPTESLKSHSPSHSKSSPPHSISPSQLSPSPSPSLPPTNSIAIQVDIPSSTPVTETELLSLSEVVATDYHYTETRGGGHNYIAVSDIESEDDEKSDTHKSCIYPSPPRSPSPLSPPPIHNHGMNRFQRIEEQLLVLEQTAENMRDDLVSSKRMLHTIDRISSRNDQFFTTTVNLSKQLWKAPITDSQDQNILNEDLPVNLNPLDTGNDKLKSTDYERSGDVTTSSSIDKHKRNLRKWMNKKYCERHTEYRTHREELRNKERRPYQPQTTNVSSKRTSKTLQERRIQLEKENYNSRLKEAHELMNDLISSKPSVSCDNLLIQEPKKEQPQRLTSSANFPVKPAGGNFKRRISSVEGLSPKEVDKMTEILASTEIDRDSLASVSTVVTSIDWSEVDLLLRN